MERERKMYLALARQILDAPIVACSAPANCPHPIHSQPSDGPFNRSDAEVYILLM